MKCISLTRGKSAIVDDDDYDYLSQFKWYCSSDGYAQRMVRENGGRHTVRMHRVILNTPKGMDSDHINRNKLDNRRSNLRIATRSENQANKRNQINSTSGRKGVVWNRRARKWQVKIEFRGERIHLGYFDDIDDASNAYKVKAEELFGEFARVE